MSLATTQGKAAALAAWQSRRAENKTRKRIDNSALRAGSPMHFDCVACGGDIVVSEGYVSKSNLCSECQILKDLGWLAQSNSRELSFREVRLGEKFISRRTKRYFGAVKVAPTETWSGGTQAGEVPMHVIGNAVLLTDHSGGLAPDAGLILAIKDDELVEVERSVWDVDIRPDQLRSAISLPHESALFALKASALKALAGTTLDVGDVTLVGTGAEEVGGVSMTYFDFALSGGDETRVYVE